MPTFADLEQHNPNIREQYDEWRSLRTHHGEDATDYQAFRKHAMAIGAPAPGPDEPDDFVGEDFKRAHPERYGQRSS
jgi:hypothetical protein